MQSSNWSSAVSAYAAAVRTELAGLTAADRDVLVEDLEEHLAEVAAEGEGPLEDRLGSPAQYAKELVRAYGAQPPADRRRSLADQLRGAIAWLTATNVYRAVLAFLPELRPAWWVLRGYLAVLILTTVFSPGYLVGPIPNLGTKRGLLELVLSGIAIWLSVRIGRRRQSSAGLVRFATWSANGVIAIVALAVLGGMANLTGIEAVQAGPVDQNLSSGTAFSVGQVTNIYPYSQDGKPLTNVLLFDQEGRPVILPQSGDSVSQYPMGADGQAITNAYPLNQHHPDGSAVVPPRVAIPPWPSATPSTSASPTASATPSPTH